MKRLVLVFSIYGLAWSAFGVIYGSVGALAGCSGSQRTTEHAAVTCAAADAQAIIATLDDKTTNGAGKLLALAAIEQQVTACMQAAKPPVAAGSAR